MKRRLLILAVLALWPVGGEARSLHGGGVVDYWFDITSDSTPRVTGFASSSPFTSLDLAGTTYTTATAQDDRVVHAAVSTAKGTLGPVTWSSSNTSIATVNSSGVVTHVYTADNLAHNVTITGTADNFSATKVLTLQRTGGATTMVRSGYASTSLSYHASNQIDTRIAGKTSTVWPIFSARNDSTATYTRNPSCWAAAVDLTPVATYGSGSGTSFNGILISPRHVVCAAHAARGTGQTIRFVKADGTAVTRTIANTAFPADDLEILILDSDVSSGISFARVLPANWAHYFPSLSTGATVPAIEFNQFAQALVADWYSAPDYALFITPADATRKGMNTGLIPGDSGSPGCLIINNALVVLCTWHYPNGGPFVSNYITQINAAMHTLSTSVSASTDYQLTPVNLTGFTSY